MLKLAKFIFILVPLILVLLLASAEIELVYLSTKISNNTGVADISVPNK